MTLVCIDCRYIGDKPSGIGEVTWGLVRHLPRLAPDLDFLFLRGSAPQGPLSTASNVTPSNVTEALVTAPANSPQTMWWLPKLVDLKHVNLFHAPFNILPSGLEMPTLTTIHDIMWLTHPDWCNSSLYGQIERRFYANGIRRAFNRSTAIAAVSGATRSEISRVRPEIDDKVSVTLSGVSRQFAKVSIQDETLRSIGLRPGQRFVLTAGQCAPYKNHEGALRAFARSFAQNSGQSSEAREDVRLVMVQRRNAGADHLRSLAQELGIGAQVHFTGPVTFPTLLELYSGALALLHPSFCEGFGNPIAEAMACGLPVITSNISAMPEVTGGAAVLVDPYNVGDIAAALTKVASDKDLARSMREKGLARAGELSWERFAKDNLAIYRKLLASS